MTGNTRDIRQRKYVEHLLETFSHEVARTRYTFITLAILRSKFVPLNKLMITAILHRDCKCVSSVAFNNSLNLVEHTAACCHIVPKYVGFFLSLFSNTSSSSPPGTFRGLPLVRRMIDVIWPMIWVDCFYSLLAYALILTHT